MTEETDEGKTSDLSRREFSEIDAPVGNEKDREEYVRFYINHTSINMILNHRRDMSIRLLKNLRNAGIGSAGQVPGLDSVPGITGVEWEAVRSWHAELTKEYTRDYDIGMKHLRYSVRQFVEARMQNIRLEHLPFHKPFSDSVMRRIQGSGVATIAQYKNAADLNVPWQEKRLLQEWQEQLETYFEKEYRSGKVTPVLFAINNVYKQMLGA